MPDAGALAHLPGRRSELGAYQVGFGGAELGVAGEGLFPVPTGRGLVAERGFGVAEAAVGVRLLIGVADLAGQCEGIVVPGAGLGRVAGGEEDLAEQVERFGPSRGVLRSGHR